MRNIFISLLVLIFSTSLVFAQPSASYDTADQISTDTTNFTGDGNLSSEDDTVQKALETLDGLTGAKGWNIEGSNVHTTDAIANVGIGTSMPEYTLEVSGDINADAINVNGTRVCVQGDSTCLPPAGGWTDTGTNIFTTDLSRNVGIGTATPEAKLHVAGGVIFDGSFSGMILQNGFKINGGTTRKFIIEQTGGTHDSNLRVDLDTTEGVASVDSSSSTPIDTLKLVDIDLETNGTVTADSFVGDGSGLTGISGSGSIGIGTANTITYWPTTTTVGSLPTGTYPSLTELSYVKGTTSSLQAQINALSGGGSGINWSSYNDIVSLSQTDEFLVNNSGTNKSINWQYIENNLPFVQGYMGAVEFDLNNRETVYATSSTATSVYNASTTNAPISFGAWIYARSNGRSTLGSIIDKGLGENTGKGYHIHLYAGNSSTAKIGSNVGCNDADADKATAADGASNGSVPLNQWVRVIATFNQDGDKKMKTYVNGAEISYASNTACTGNVGDDTALDFYIGNKKDGSVTFDGYIRDVFVARGKAMTSAEVLADYKGQLSSGITARYAFTEGIGQYVHEFYGGNTAQTGTIASSVFTQGALNWLSPSRSFVGGNQGIGTTIPTATMHIVNPLTVDTFRIDDSNGDTTPFVVTSAGNVGIGTYSPTALSKVQVIGTVTATAFVGDGSGLTGVPAASGAGGWEDGGTNVYNSATTDNVGIGTTTPTATLLVENAVSTIDSFRVNDSVADGTPFIISSNGNVGIGTTTSAKQLVVGSTGQVTFDNSGNVVFSSSTGSTDTLNISNNSLTSGNALDVSSSSSSQMVPLGIFTLSGASSGGTLRVNQSSATSTGRMFHGTNAGTGDTFLIEDVATDSTPFLIASDGNVGIGTTTASLYKLQVIGTVSATTFVGDGSALTGISGGANGWADGGTNVYTTTTTDKVGIGTTTPATTVEIVKQSTNAPLYVSSSVSGAGDFLRINSDGNVGIGTTTALNRKLTVQGGIASQDSAGTAGSLVLTESAANGSNTVTLSAPSSITSDKTWTLPVTDGSSGDMMVTNGSGVLSFSSPSSGGWTDAGATINTTTSTDNVGIGTSSPEKKLVLAGADSDMRIKSTTSSAYGEIQFYSDAGEAFNIGVGGSTTSPANEAFFENVISGGPINFISNGGVFGFNGGPVRAVPTDTPPTCNSGLEGGIYADDSLNEPCFCNGSSWVQMDGGGAC